MEGGPEYPGVGSVHAFLYSGGEFQAAEKGALDPIPVEPVSADTESGGFLPQVASIQRFLAPGEQPTVRSREQDFGQWRVDHFGQGLQHFTRDLQD